MKAGEEPLRFVKAWKKYHAIKLDVDGPELQFLIGICFATAASAHAAAQ